MLLHKLGILVHFFGLGSRDGSAVCGSGGNHRMVSSLWFCGLKSICTRSQSRFLVCDISQGSSWFGLGSFLNRVSCYTTRQRQIRSDFHSSTISVQPYHAFSGLRNDFHRWKKPVHQDGGAASQTGDTNGASSSRWNLCAALCV